MSQLSAVEIVVAIIIIVVYSAVGTLHHREAFSASNLPPARAVNLIHGSATCDLWKYGLK